MMLEEQEARATERVSRLVYGEDVRTGMQVRQQYHDETSPPNPLIAAISGQQCRFVDEWVAVAEVRRYGDVCSAIGVREDGKQVPLQFHVGSLLEVAEGLA